VVDAKPLAIACIPSSLLLLLLLLARFQHPSFCQFDGLTQHIEIADMVGKNENQRGVEIGALLVAQAAVGFDDGAKGVVGLFKIRTGR
jgi:hypothetical protein